MSILLGGFGASRIYGLQLVGVILQEAAVANVAREDVVNAFDQIPEA